MRGSSLRISRSRGSKKELHVLLGPSVRERFAVNNGFVVAGAGSGEGAGAGAIEGEEIRILGKEQRRLQVVGRGTTGQADKGPSWRWDKSTWLPG